MRSTRFLLLILLVAGCSSDADSSARIDNLDVASVDQGEFDAGETDTGDPDAAMPAALIEESEILAYVDPFIGTGGAGFAYAALTPAAQMPLGMVRLGPDSTLSGNHSEILHHYSGYYWRDPDLRGFSHTHFVGTGVTDYGNIRLSPTTRTRIEQRGIGRTFSPHDKDRETAAPGYYSAYLEDPAVQAELTASDHVGFHRYTFDGAGPHLIAFDMGSSVSDKGVEAARIEVDGGEIRGWVDYDGSYVGRRNAFRLFVEGRVSPAPESVEVWTERRGELADATEAEGDTAGALLSWDSLEEPVTFTVAISFIDAEQAAANFTAEASDFESVRARAEAAWLEKLRRARVAGGTERERTIFYTALYNTYRMPTLFDEYGRYRGLDGEVHESGDFTYYSDLSLWDTYRTLHPWFTVYDPQAQRDSLNSLLAMARDGGFVPRWPAGLSYTGGMLGSSADLLFGESATKGLEGVDYEEAYDALVRSHDPPDGSAYGGRGSMAEYVANGYVPADISEEGASETLEYAVHDSGMALLARHLGMDATVYEERAKSYENLYDAQTGFFRPRLADGTFLEDFDPEQVHGRSGYFVEGSAWQWLFHVQHDPEGLAAILGEDEMLARLETFHEESNLWVDDKDRLAIPNVHHWHSNQPSLHTPYLYAALDRLDRQEYWVERVREAAYDDTPRGIVGNDDGGTLSAWYVFSAAGFFPVNGTTRYTLSPPVFERMVLELETGTLEIRRGDADLDNATLDGQPVGPYLEHRELFNAEVFEY